MKLTAPHEPPGYVGGLHCSALGGRMSGQITGDGDKDAPALVGFSPFTELAHAGLQHLIGVEFRVLA